MSTDILSTVPLFSKLPLDERTEVEKLLKTQEYPANRPIVWLGEQGEDFYIVKHGKVVVSCPDESGKEVVLGQLGPGQFFGEISLLDGGPRTATVRASVDSEMLILTRPDFLEFLRRHPDAAIYMLGILGKRQRDTNEKLRGIRNVNDAVSENLTRWQIIAERIAGISASQWFVLLNLLFFIVWTTVNVILKNLGRTPWDDPPSFGTLGFIVTIEALFISLFVLITQGQQGERDRIRADLDYQVNLKAHQEVMQLHQKVDRLQTVIAQITSGVGERNIGT
ncbi:MAG TPA: cyclic nucleotide-binding domain-containing protein [Tepidisphaeraceae bacterium]|nr:cyclic nucleotide-binding domain-containing protein [Tepidisphaeraceae bacterium]